MTRYDNVIDLVKSIGLDKDFVDDLEKNIKDKKESYEKLNIKLNEYLSDFGCEEFVYNIETKFHDKEDDLKFGHAFTIKATEDYKEWLVFTVNDFQFILAESEDGVEHRGKYYSVLAIGVG